MKEGQEIIQVFENTKISVIFSEQHEFLIDSNALALCYQVTESNLRHHKNNNPSDFIEGKHFVSVSNTHGGSPKTYWTQRGVVQLGFFIKSETATRFRRWAEDLIIKSSQKQPVQVLPTTYKEALIALLEQVEENEKQTKAIEEMKPKAEFYDAVTESTDTIDLGELAKVLNVGIGRNKLFEVLRKEGILMKGNIPKQTHISNGWFKLVECKFETSTGPHIHLKPVVFQKGVDGIRKILNKVI